MPAIEMKAAVMPARSVSVIIPTYRKREFLEPTLTSLGRQTYPAEFTEVVVVDDCSGDGTFEFLKSLETPFTLVPVMHEVNKGRSAARNTAIGAATGDPAVFVSVGALHQGPSGGGTVAAIVDLG